MIIRCTRIVDGPVQLQAKLETYISCILFTICKLNNIRRKDKMNSNFKPIKTLGGGINLSLNSVQKVI